MSTSGQHIWMFHLQPCIICIMLSSDTCVLINRPYWLHCVLKPSNPLLDYSLPFSSICTTSKKSTSSRYYRLTQLHVCPINSIDQLDRFQGLDRTGAFYNSRRRTACALRDMGSSLSIGASMLALNSVRLLKPVPLSSTEIGAGPEAVSKPWRCRAYFTCQSNQNTT